MHIDVKVFLTSTVKISPSIALTTGLRKLVDGWCQKFKFMFQSKNKLQELYQCDSFILLLQLRVLLHQT